MEEVWIARDEDNDVFIYREKPMKGKHYWEPVSSLRHPENCDCILLNRDLFPSIRWEDKQPTKAKITLMK